LHNISVLTVWGAKVEDDRVPLAGYSYRAASGSEVNTCGRECLKINQGSHCFILIKVLFICFFILIKVLFICFFILIKMYFEPPELSTSEVDFVIQEEGEVTPIEVKSGENLKAKSFRLFCEKYKPSKAI